VALHQISNGLFYTIMNCRIFEKNIFVLDGHLALRHGQDAKLGVSPWASCRLAI